MTLRSLVGNFSGPTGSGRNDSFPYQYPTSRPICFACYGSGKQPETNSFLPHLIDVAVPQNGKVTAFPIESYERDCNGSLVCRWNRQWKRFSPNLNPSQLDHASHRSHWMRQNCRPAYSRNFQNSGLRG